MKEGSNMSNKSYKRENINEKSVENRKEIEKLRKRVTELNKLIVEFEFDNRHLRMEVTFLYSKLERKLVAKEDYESCY